MMMQNIGDRFFYGFGLHAKFAAKLPPHYVHGSFSFLFALNKVLTALF
jgi:hypothetical protein